jgi:hypothetical protein
MPAQTADDGPLTQQELSRRSATRRRVLLPLAVWIVASNLGVPILMYFAERLKGYSTKGAAIVAIITWLLMVACDIALGYLLWRGLRKAYEADRRRLIR